MLVYRIEDAQGFGAFNGLAHIHDSEVPGDMHRSCYDGPSAYGEANAGYPAIQNAFRDKPQVCWRFGTKSLDQLREWFFNPVGCAAMGTAGGLLVTYEVPEEHVAMGSQQLVFALHRATKVSAVSAARLHLDA